MYGFSFDGSTGGTDSRSDKNATKQADADEKNTRTLREAAFGSPPLGVEGQKYIDDLWVSSDTATVQFVGMVEPGDEFMTIAERIQEKETCGSVTKVVAKNDIPVNTVKVMNSRDQELETCEVKRRTTAGKDKHEH